MTAYVFDTERTDKDQGEIIEAAWLRMPAVTDLAGESDEIPTLLRPTFAQCQRFKPSKPITFGSMAVHHILPCELETCPPSSGFALPADTVYLIGHSVDFDWIAAGAPANVKRIDTHAMSQWLWPETSGHSQSALLYMLLGATHVTRDKLSHAHGALVDAWNNLSLLKQILLLKPEIQTWSALWQYSEQCRVPMFCPFKNRAGVKLVDLDDSYIDWCLSQDWIDSYLRKGLEQIVEQRMATRGNGAAFRFDEVDVDDDEDLDLDELDDALNTEDRRDDRDEDDRRW